MGLIVYTLYYDYEEKTLVDETETANVNLALYTSWRHEEVELELLSFLT